MADSPEVSDLSREELKREITTAQNVRVVIDLLKTSSTVQRITIMEIILAMDPIPGRLHMALKLYNEHLTTMSALDEMVDIGELTPHD